MDVPSLPAPAPARRQLLGLLLLSAAGLTFEIDLTRLFSVAQFYHFAFMIVSIALLGYGASGTVLAISPGLGRSRPGYSLGAFSGAASLATLGAYRLVNGLPFDSFSLAWDATQVWILLLHYAALALPFFFGGLATGLLLAAHPQRSGQVYAVNLLGSALGCLLALLAPAAVGGEGVVLLSSGLAALAALLVTFDPHPGAAPAPPRVPGRPALAWPVFGPPLAGLLLLLSVLGLGARLAGHPPPPLLALRLSPYKSLSYALQYPGAQLIYQRWNSFSRVDLVRSPGIHAYPGLSYQYMQPLPAQDGLLVDGDDLTPLVRPGQDLAFTAYLPAALAFRLRPAAEALVLEPRAGLDPLTALAQGARRVTVVEMNPLVVEAAGQAGSHLYRDPRLRLELDSGRSYLRRTRRRFDVILLSLASAYHPVRSGAYSLAEDYRYTVEAFQDALAHLGPGGLLVVTRWLQDPPSEELRAFALAASAVEGAGGDPRAQIVALRGYNTATLLARNGPFTPQELQQVREFAARRAFDLVYAPGLRAEESNRYNILPEPVYYQAYSGLLQAPSRAAFYAGYAYDVTPPTDDHPFFGHFFKWSQAGQVLGELGRTWQPFGGAGYFVVLALLLLALLLSGLLIILPAAVAGRAAPPAAAPRPVYLFYFAAIGFAFMLVEIPLIQRFILFLGHPAYALTAVLFSLLICSALGAATQSGAPARPGRRISPACALPLLVLLLLAAPWLLPGIFRLALGLPLALRLGLTALLLAPPGFLMGTAFPGGIRWMLAGRLAAAGVPWVWAVNGAASVVASVLAALLALSLGFDWVLRLGALCYAAAWLAIRLTAASPAPAAPPPR